MKISFAVDMPQTEAHGWETHVSAALDHNGSTDENTDCGVTPWSTPEYLKREEKLRDNS